MDRPSKGDENILKEVAVILTKELNDYVEENGFSEEEIFDVLDYGGDGYELMKKLERDTYCTGDTEMVNILDQADSIIYKIHSKYEKEWAKDIKPEYAVGNIVVFNRNRKEEYGEIVGIYEKEAKYKIFCEHLGHVREGNGTNGLILEYEGVLRKKE